MWRTAPLVQPCWCVWDDRSGTVRVRGLAEDYVSDLTEELLRKIKICAKHSHRPPSQLLQLLCYLDQPKKFRKFLCRHFSTWVAAHKPSLALTSSQSKPDTNTPKETASTVTAVKRSREQGTGKTHTSGSGVPIRVRKRAKRSSNPDPKGVRALGNADTPVAAGRGRALTVPAWMGKKDGEISSTETPNAPSKQPSSVKNSKDSSAASLSPTRSTNDRDEEISKTDTKLRKRAKRSTDSDPKGVMLSSKADRPVAAGRGRALTVPAWMGKTGGEISSTTTPQTSSQVKIKGNIDYVKMPSVTDATITPSVTGRGLSLTVPAWMGKKEGEISSKEIEDGNTDRKRQWSSAPSAPSVTGRGRALTVPAWIKNKTENQSEITTAKGVMDNTPSSDKSAARNREISRDVHTPAASSGRGKAMTIPAWMQSGTIPTSSLIEQSADLACRQREAEEDASVLLTKIALETTARENPPADNGDDVRHADVRRHAGASGPRCVLVLEDVAAADKRCWVDVARALAEKLQDTVVSGEGPAATIGFGNAALFRQLCVNVLFLKMIHRPCV